MKKFWFIIIVLIFASGFWYYHFRQNSVVKTDLPPAQNYQNFVKPPKTATSGATVSAPVATKTAPIITPTEKKQINLAVPFTSQAPTANWAEPFQNACEEASVLMVDYYYADKSLPSKQAVEKIFLNLVQWQIDNWGGHNNLPIAKVAEFTELNFPLRAEIVYDLTADKIRNYLDQGLPVIVPANGRELDNPNFTNGGPEYHMLVIKGYLDNKFITDDPGTRNGHDFVYAVSNLLSSIHDWDESSAKADGPKIALVLHKK